MEYSMLHMSLQNFTRVGIILPTRAQISVLENVNIHQEGALYTN